MSFFFANPVGFWALLSLPAILAVHLFQRRARRLMIATSFLLEHRGQESKAGRRLSFWRNSWAFWLQLLAALLLSLLLAQPRWIQTDSQQQVALVLDGSASMQAFAPAAKAAAREVIGAATRAAARTEWLLRDSRPDADRLYGGHDRAVLEKALDDWIPVATAHPIERALQAARLAVGREGRVIFITDHEPVALPGGVELVAVGEPTANVGIAGVRVRREGGQPIWQAVVRNYSTTPETRAWWVALSSGRTESRTLQMAPGAVQTLSGRFPEGLTELTLHLEADALPVDDRVPVVVPQSKPLSYRLFGDSGVDAILGPILRRMEAVGLASGEPGADFALVASRGRVEERPDIPHAIVIGGGPAQGGLANPSTLTERHPLVEGLSFDGLIITHADAQPFTPDEAATVLVWDREEPLIFLEPHGQGQRLVFNFYADGSNLDRLPAFVVLVHRFVERIRLHKLAAWRENFELAQTLPLPPAATRLSLQQAGSPAVVSLPARAPEIPSFFTLAANGEPLVSGATQFLDIREADLRNAASANTFTAANQTAALSHSSDDFLLPVWLFLAIALCLGSYHFAERNR